MADRAVADRGKFAAIKQKMAPNATGDYLEAFLAIEEDLGTLNVVRKYKWDDYLFSKLPSSLFVKIEKRDEGVSRSHYVSMKKKAEIINEILIKSWETQGSLCPGFASVVKELRGNRGNKKLEEVIYPPKVLVTSRPHEINTLLMYYLKNLDIGVNMKRVVGSIHSTHRFVYSFLVLNVGDLLATEWSHLLADHSIDNTFSEGEMKLYTHEPKKMFEINLKSKYIDGDPANPEYKGTTGAFTGSLKDERLVYGPDEKAEQIFVYHSVKELIDYVPDMMISSKGLALYDIKMRQFIKEKHGVEIENLAKKWSKLCWSCFAPSQDLKKCSKCRISRYCGKKCQVQDWKVHKIVHQTENLIMETDPCAIHRRMGW